MDALRSKGPSGVASRMRPSCRAWLAGALDEGPAAHGWVEISGGRLRGSSSTRHSVPDVNDQVCGVASMMRDGLGKTTGV